jgi:hypothetical protein
VLRQNAVIKVSFRYRVIKTRTSSAHFAKFCQLRPSLTALFWLFTHSVAEYYTPSLPPPPHSRDFTPINRQRWSIKPSIRGILMFWMASLYRTFCLKPTCLLVLQLARESWIQYTIQKINGFINPTRAYAFLKGARFCLTNMSTIKVRMTFIF